MEDLKVLCEEKALALKTLFSKHHKVYTTAESLTAGMISSFIVGVSGSSSWFDRGFVTYSNESKMELLGVKEETLKSVGAVSEQTACEMAKGAILNSHADISVSVTGIAGPEGGSALKPVGTVWIGGCVRDSYCAAKCFLFKGDREEVRERTVYEALKVLESLTKGQDPFADK